ncbi:unnamed protein product [Knipowitschia caucasica]
MNVLRCSNAKQGPTAAYDAYKKILRKDTTALFLAAALEHFGLKDLSDTPDNFIPAYIESGSPADQRTWLHDKTSELIEKYVMMPEIFCKANGQPTAQFQCRDLNCTTAYTSSNAREIHEKKKHNLVLSSPPSPSTTTTIKPDSIKEHSEARLGFSFVLLNMMDAVKEGDGERLMRLYQVALLFYKAYGHTQYAYSTLLLTLQLNVTLSPRMAHSLKWNRFWNGRGGQGKNIPLDLHLEHMNNYLKSFLKGLGPNLTENSANRISKSIGILKEMMDNTDRELEVTKPSGVHHTTGEEQDIATLVAIFKDGHIFKEQPGREYQSFPSFGKDLLERLNYADLYLWIQTKIKDWRKVAL